jgi:hypothetical protein
VRRTEDPLAELARLIGQEDPFADFVAHRPAEGRTGGHAGVPRRTHARDPRAPDPRALRRPAGPSRPADGHDDGYGHDEPAPAEGRGAYAYGGARAPRADDIPAVSPRAPREDRMAPPRPAARSGLARQVPGYDDQESEIDLEQPRQAREPRGARRTPAPQREEESYGEYAAEDYDPEYDDDAYLPAHGDEFYDEAPRRRLKGWMLVGVAAAAAIIVGTSGLFAYRALFGTNDVAMPAKVISPVAGPTKVVPGSASQSDKRIQDRVGGEPPRTAERIVPREENPIDQSRIPQGNSGDRIPGGTVSPIPQFSAAPGQQASAPPPAAQTVAPANISTEPRRVRTVTVRADGSVVSDQNRGPATAANTGRTAPATAAQPQGNPLALQGQAAALPPPRPAGTASSAPLQGDNPWSNLSSGQVSVPNTQAALPPQQAPVQAAPPPAVVVQTPPPAGSYVVQVAAQKSEGEAQASWQSLQQRYASVLGSQQATIRRVDLGERGVFYRAQVGPFTSRAQASEVCQSLKAAGGECVIQRN